MLMLAFSVTNSDTDAIAWLYTITCTIRNINIDILAGYAVCDRFGDIFCHDGHDQQRRQHRYAEYQTQKGNGCQGVHKSTTEDSDGFPVARILYPTSPHGIHKKGWYAHI